jgi:hypothetical protein
MNNARDVNGTVTRNELERRRYVRSLIVWSLVGFGIMRELETGTHQVFFFLSSRSPYVVTLARVSGESGALNPMLDHY